jgi:hypothetical protein
MRKYQKPQNQTTISDFRLQNGFFAPEDILKLSKIPIKDVSFVKKGIRALAKADSKKEGDENFEALKKLVSLDVPKTHFSLAFAIYGNSDHRTEQLHEEFKIRDLSKEENTDVLGASTHISE